MSRTCRLLAAVFLLSAVNSATRADDVCDALKNIMANAGEQFIPLRGDFDFYLDEYQGLVTLGDLTECSTSSGDGVAEYACSIDLPDDRDRAHALFADLVDKVKECFGEDIKRKRGGEDSIEFEYLPTNDTLDVRYRRAESPTGKWDPHYYVKIEATYVDISQ